MMRSEYPRCVDYMEMAVSGLAAVRNHDLFMVTTLIKGAGKIIQPGGNCGF
jgi:hypothetical protein